MRTPAQRRQVARIAAHALHAKYDSRELTAAARMAFDKKFELEVDPEGQLPVDERLRRAGHARKAFFARLALASVKARAKRGQRRRRKNA